MADPILGRDRAGLSVQMARKLGKAARWANLPALGSHEMITRALGHEVGRRSKTKSIHFSLFALSVSVHRVPPSAPW